MASKRKYYAVKAGHVPGIYETWEACKRQVTGFKGNQYKSFPSLGEAQKYLESDESSFGVVEAPGSTRITEVRQLERDRSHSSFAPVRAIQKTARESNPFRNNAFQIHSSVLEMAVEDFYEEHVAQPAREKAQTQRNLDEASPSVTTLCPLKFTATGSNNELPVIDVDAVYQLEYDGASKGNPGHAGAGALLRHPDGTVMAELAVGLGKTTNNVAEYRGLIAGLRKALDFGIQRIQAQGDSKLVTQQVRGVWAVKNENMAVLCKEARELVKNFRDFEIRHVDREFNSAADSLANKGVGLPEEKFVSSFVLTE